MNLIWILLVAGSTSWLLTGYIRRYALSKSILDVPNERSSHSVPTPRGGGGAIIIVFLLCLPLLWLTSIIDVVSLVALMGAGLLVSVVGFIDDHGHVPARWRLVAHFSAASWLLFWFGGLPSISMFGSMLDLGMFGNLLASVAIVWLLNLYNFMDGIDGIAGIEALTSSVVAGLLFFIFIEHEVMLTMTMLMSASVVGFLVWNLPPAKIFMGDAGSGFVGLMLGAFALQSAHISPQMLWVWLILLGVFIVDATYTLIRRLLRREKVYDAHRSHAYQYASREYGSHKLVTLSVFLINVCWLAPWSAAVAYGGIDGAEGLLYAYAPLLWLVWYFHAGELEVISK